VDNNVQTPVIGVALDGTGYGSDGRLWGGEFMVADYISFQRLGHLEYLPLPGGAAAIKRPYRIAAAYLYTLLGEDAINTKLAFSKKIDAIELDLIKWQVSSGLNTPLTSSMGRLFDAVSALLDIRGIIDYEAQAAVELEAAAYGAAVENTVNEPYPYEITTDDGSLVIRFKELIAAIVRDLLQDCETSIISARFHYTVAAMVVDMCQAIARRTGINVVALGGGVFQNRLLLRTIVPLLENAQFTVLTHNQVPCNDGGLSLGQAVIAQFTASP
jgi:hydrogenase maturation protein HypF